MKPKAYHRSGAKSSYMYLNFSYFSGEQFLDFIKMMYLKKWDKLPGQIFQNCLTTFLKLHFIHEKHIL